MVETHWIFCWARYCSQKNTIILKCYPSLARTVGRVAMQKKILCNLPSEAISGWKRLQFKLFQFAFRRFVPKSKVLTELLHKRYLDWPPKNSLEITFSLKTVWTYTIQLKVQRISSYFEKHPDISTVIWPNYFTIY